MIDDYVHGPQVNQLARELVMARLRVGLARGLVVGQDMHVQPGFGDIDADEDFLHDSFASLWNGSPVLPSLAMRGGDPLATVRACDREIGARRPGLTHDVRCTQGVTVYRAQFQLQHTRGHVTTEPAYFNPSTTPLPTPRQSSTLDKPLMRGA